MRNFKCIFEEGKFYHVYNRGNNREDLFYKNANYEYFLRKFDEYHSGYLDVYAFCLLPNHFHFLVRVKEKTEGIGKGIPSLKAMVSLNERICESFRKFFITYAQAINKQQGRTGSLFQKNFKRLEVTSERYFAHLVYYIHANPQLHKITNDFRQYPWSSYKRILIGKPSKLKKEFVIEWFNDRNNYIYFHNQQIETDSIREMIIEG